MNKSPMFLMLDSSRYRMDLLQQYVDNGSLRDPVAIRYDTNLFSTFLDQPDEQRPIGFQQFGEWGAPKGSPGQKNWHLKYKEHELIGWMLAMHFVEAMDIAVEVVRSAGQGWHVGILNEMKEPRRAILHKPIWYQELDEDSISSLVYGSPMKGNAGDDRWAMNHVSCRTSFQHIEQGPLDDLIVSGVVERPEDLDPAITSQDDSTFERGWVFDVGKMERSTKRQLIPFGGLGYIDEKTALYGIPASGTLHLWLPLLKGSKALPRSLVVCEVSEKRGDKECNVEKDMSFLVGGKVSSKISRIQRTGTAYLGKPICVSVGIPPDAVVIPRPESMAFLNTEEGSASVYGITLDITVTGSQVTLKDGACSVSHIVWEEAQ